MKAGARKAAQLAGLKHYFTGVPCSNGHVSNRLSATAQCVDCARMYSRQWAKNNRQYFRKWERANKDKRTHYQLKYYYDMSLEEYNAMSAQQNHLCAICSRKPRYGERLAVDHCHNGGGVRGLLCKQCNVGLGSFNDDPERLSQAIAYLAALKKKEQA